MQKDKQSYSEMLVTDEERALVEYERQLPALHPRLRRIVETVYNELGYGEIVADEPDDQ